MTYPIPLWKRVFWTILMLSGVLGYATYEHWLAGVAVGLGAYRLFQMDMLEMAVQAFQTTVEEYENSGPEIEDYASDQEVIEELAEESDRTVLTSYTFAKRLEELGEAD